MNSSSIYVLYKYYNSKISKHFHSKDVHKMSKEKLKNYYIKLTLLYKYSKECYVLREKYRDMLTKDLIDENHQISIDIIKKYNKDVLTTIIYIENIFNVKFTQKEYKNNIYKLLEIDDDLDEDDEDDEEEKVNEKCTQYTNEQKIEITNKIKELDDNKFLDNIIKRQTELEKKIYNAIEKRLKSLKLNFYGNQLFFIINDICYKIFEKSYNLLLDNEKIEFIEKIKTYDSEHLIFIMDNIKFNYSNVNIEDFINITIKMGGYHAIGSTRIMVDKTTTLKIVLHQYILEINLFEHDNEAMERMNCGENFIFSKNQYYLSKKNVLKLNKTVESQIKENSVIYLHLSKYFK